MEHVITIAPSGGVKAMHNDKFPLGFLGPQIINRASDIRWNEGTQLWGVWFALGDRSGFLTPPAVYDGFDSYDAARAFEVKVMNESMKQDRNPLHTSIMAWARTQRKP